MLAQRLRQSRTLGDWTAAQVPPKGAGKSSKGKQDSAPGGGQSEASPWVTVARAKPKAVPDTWRLDCTCAKVLEGCAAKKKLRKVGDVQAEVILAGSAEEVADLRRLAQIAQVTEAVAVVCDFDPEDSLKAVSKPLASVNQRGSKAVRDWRCVPLVEALPERTALRRSSTFQAPDRELTALRAHVAKAYLDTEAWKLVSKNPDAYVRTSLPEVHSTSNWQLQCGGRKDEQEEVLQGILRVPSKDACKVLDASGRAGIFVSHLASHEQSRPQVDPTFARLRPRPRLDTFHSLSVEVVAVAWGLDS